MLWILCGWTIAKLETCSYSVKLKKLVEDHTNSPYSIVDRVRVNVGSDDKGLKCYQLPQEEVDRIERMLKGGNDSDIESDDKSVGKDAASEDEIDDHPRRVSCNREFKIWRRQRQRQRHKSMIWLVEWRKIIVPHVWHAFWCNVLT